MWYRDNEPQMFDQIDKVIGTKDFVNYKLTGEIVTDPSYASGSGVYDLLAGRIRDPDRRRRPAARHPPEIVPATEMIGGLTAQSAAAMGLPQGLPVVAGGVDNSCMALGARNIADGVSTTLWAPPVGSPSPPPCRFSTIERGRTYSPT